MAAGVIRKPVNEKTRLKLTWIVKGTGPGWSRVLDKNITEP